MQLCCKFSFNSTPLPTHILKPVFLKQDNFAVKTLTPFQNKKSNCGLIIVKNEKGGGCSMKFGLYKHCVLFVLRGALNYAEIYQAIC